MAAFVRTAFVTLVFCGLILCGFWWFTHDQQRQALREMSALNDDLKRRLAERQAMVDRLSRSRRVAHVLVTDQRLEPTGEITETAVQFIELDDQGSELARQSFTIPGDVLFIDAWTVKFDQEKVAQGDPLMGRTLVLLRRIYSDRMKPLEGKLIDTPGAVPPGYATGEPGQFEKRIWDNFWALATDARTAAAFGVRVAQGEAVYKPVRAGQTYELIVDSAGGMSLTPVVMEEDSASTLTQAEQ